MKLKILFGQRQERYPGEYAPEIIAAMTEYEHEGNLNYLHAQQTEAESSGEFVQIRLVDVSVSLSDLQNIFTTPCIEGSIK